MIELQAADQIGASHDPGRTPGRCERTPERKTQRRRFRN
jgi:hypothetical protein